MLTVQPTSLYRQNTAFTAGKLDDEQKENLRDGSVAGGAAGGGLKMFKNARNASKLTAETTQKIKEGQQLVREVTTVTAKPVEEAKGLWASFKANCKLYKTKLFDKLTAIKTSKYIKPILNNRVVKFGCGIVGGALAGCVLISGIGTLYNNTTKIADHYAPEVADKMNSLADGYKNFKNELV